jgi:hypothetical protein
MRPSTGSGLSHHVGHFTSLALAGSLYYLGYPGSLTARLAAAVEFAGGLEMLQMMVLTDTLASLIF